MFKAVVMARQACVIIHIYNRKDMKIGDKVRFLSETGGGVVAGFQGKNIVLVEDEDGFQIPMAINDVVLVASENYDIGNVVSGKTAASSNPSPVGTSNRSVKSLLDDGEEDVSMEVDDDPASREVTFRMPAEEREGGNKLSVAGRSLSACQQRSVKAETSCLFTLRLPLSTSRRLPRPALSHIS